MSRDGKTMGVRRAAAATQGARLLWQGAPKRARFAREALALPWIGLYLGTLVGLCGFAATWNVAAGYAILALVALGLFWMLGYAMAASTTYSLTTAHIVIEYGFALPKSVTLPYRCINAVSLRANADGTGDIAIRLETGTGLRGLLLWPHIRLSQRRIEPTLRAVPAVATAADILNRQLAMLPSESVRPAASPQSPMGLPMGVAAE